MSMSEDTCGRCWYTNHFYQQLHIVPECPKCGYPKFQPDIHSIKELEADKQERRNKVKQ